MPNTETELSNQQLFSLWVEQQLTEAQQQLFEQRCLHDLEFAQQVETYNLVAGQSEQYRQQAVPQWDRNSTFDMPQKTKWWQWQGLPSVSLAMSLCAIIMVISGFEIQVNNGALTISFSSQSTSRQIDQLVEERLATFEQAQQLALTEYSQSIRQQQMDASAQLTQYLLTASRQERREDFAELIKYVNEQRGDDQLFYARQLNQLQQNIYAKPSPVGINPE